MNKDFTKQWFKGKSTLFVFLIFFAFGLFICDNSYSTKHWSQYNIEVRYNRKDGAIVIKLKFIHYGFGPADENGYLEWCNFSFYDSDISGYKGLVSIESYDQNRECLSLLKLHRELPYSKIQFIDCHEPVSGTIWNASQNNQTIKVPNNGKEAFFTFKWFLGPDYNRVNSVKVSGKWHVSKSYKSELFNDLVYKVVNPHTMTIEQDGLDMPKDLINENRTETKNNAVYVSKHADGIVIKGAALSESIMVYSCSGVQIKTIVRDKDVEKINLPANQIYIIAIGQSRHKVAL